MKQSESKFFLFISFIGLSVVYFLGLQLDVMDVDAAQYASISLEMLNNKSFLEVKHWNHDYLDKPPLLFWLSSLSFSWFGVSNFTYKLPSFLFSLLGFYSTYRFAKLYYEEKTARLSALILASCQAMFLINNDVRTDTILTGSVIFSVWQLASFLKNGRTSNLLLGSAGIGLSMLAKGPIGIIIPILAFSGDWILKRQWKNFFKWQWGVALLIIAILLFPMCIGLHRQFGVEGLKFYFWTQSFGRITGENRWDNDAGYFFFIPTFLWAFLPWSLLFVRAIALGFYNLVKSGFKIQGRELISISGFVLTFVALSFSHYKLPHYIFVIFPFASVITAKLADDLPTFINKPFLFLQTALCIILWAGTGFIAFHLFPVQNILLLITLFFFLGMTVLSFFMSKNNILIPSLLSIIGANILLNTHFYPEILKYQPSKNIAERIRIKKIPFEKFYNYKTNSHALDFYIGKVAQEVYSEEQLKNVIPGGAWIFATEEGFKEITNFGIAPIAVDTLQHFKITQLNYGFLNPSTREKITGKRYLLKY